jgi:hypothetical protein
MTSERPPREVKPVVLFGDNKNTDPNVRDFRATVRDAREPEAEAEGFDPVVPATAEDSESVPQSAPVLTEGDDGGNKKKRA